MTLRDVALLIPAEYRDLLLETNAIYKAIAIPTDPHMFQLFTLWTTYINATGGHDMNCTACLGEILNNFKRMQDTLVDLQKEDQLLDL